MANKRLWTEDECTRYTDGHEYVADAWKRLFGTKLADQTPTAIIDHGDSDEKQYGKISVWCVYGAWNEIEERSE